MLGRQSAGSLSGEFSFSDVDLLQHHCQAKVYFFMLLEIWRTLELMSSCLKTYWSWHQIVLVSRQASSCILSCCNKPFWWMIITRAGFMLRSRHPCSHVALCVNATPAWAKSSQKGVGQENISVGTEQPFVSQSLAVVCTLIYSASHVDRKFSQQAVLADG